MMEAPSGISASAFCTVNRRPLTSAPRYEDVRAFLHEFLRRRQANAAVATSDECDFSFKLTRIFSP